MTITIMTMIITLMIMTTWRREKLWRSGGREKQERNLIGRGGDSKEKRVGRVKAGPARIKRREIRETKIRKVERMASKEKRVGRVKAGPARIKRRVKAGPA